MQLKKQKIWLEKSGDCKKLGKNVYVFKEKSSKKQKILEEETIKMVNEAYKLAKKTIKKNQKFFEGIYKALIKKKILSNGDIEKIYKKTQKKKK